jgi:hypothetical protein
MLTELRYQAKINAISNKPREKKYPANSPHIYLFIYYYYYYLKKRTQTKHAIWK